MTSGIGIRLMEGHHPPQWKLKPTKRPRAKPLIMPDTLLSRSIKIKMRRKMVAETVATAPIDYFEKNEELRQCLKSWADNEGKSLGQLDVSIPRTASDRVIDNWKPMFQISPIQWG